MPAEILPTLTESALRGIACRCPRCGKGKLYAGFINLRPNCDACGLDYAFIDAGDGPAIFIIMLAGAIVVGAALIVEVKYQPPFWLHAALWLPLILATHAAGLAAAETALAAGAPVAEVAALAAAAADPHDDVHATANYRRAAARICVLRALAAAGIGPGAAESAR